MHASLVRLTEGCIHKLIDKFRETPFLFYTESDMQCYLYHLLVQEQEINRVYKTIDKRQTILIHNEYRTFGKYVKKDGYLIPSQKGRRGNFDLVIFDPTQVNLRTFNRQKVLIAIELALNEGSQHLKNDYTKLTDARNAVEHGYIVFFFRGKWLHYPAYVQEATKLRALYPDVKYFETST